MKPDQTIASIASRFDAAQTLHRQANLPQAVALYQQILREQPQHFGALHFLGVAAAQSNHPELAVELIGRSLQLNQSNAIAFNNHGNALHAAKRCGAAVESFDRAIALDKRYSDAYVNRALALIELGRCDEAIASCDKSIELAPRSVFAFIVRGMALRASGRFDEEMPNYCRAIEVDPAHAEAYYQRAMVSLLRGDLLEGWADYEWRWRIENRPIYKERRNFPQPLWLGREDLAGKTILIYTEQGFGDSIQFCRYVPMVAALGARVIFEVPKSLLSLFAKMEGIALILEKGAVLPEFDCHCPLMSLPLAFKTDRSNVPCFSKYLVCDAAKTERWRGKLGDSGKPKVGLVWSGSATHANDRNRSIPLMHWLNELPQNIHYISLQKDVRDSDMPALRSHPRIQNVASGELIDFSDTAALVECLDLVVSVDTSVAHLSGALGKPTWILLPFIPDWRWQLQTTESPWYPSAKLFRQEQAGDWKSVLERVGAALRNLP